MYKATDCSRKKQSVHARPTPTRLLTKPPDEDFWSGCLPRRRMYESTRSQIVRLLSDQRDDEMRRGSGRASSFFLRLRQRRISSNLIL